MRALLLLALSLLCVAGCQSSPDGSSLDAERGTSTVERIRPAAEVLPQRRDAARDFDYVFRKGEPMRPAFRDLTLRPQAKADGNEVRVAYPELYAITEAPKEGIRPMVEWEPMEAVVMQVPDYIGNYEGVMGTIQGIGANALTVAEVWYVIESNAMRNSLKADLASAGVSSEVIEGKTRFLSSNLESVWFIDSGPLPIIDPVTDTYAFADFRYYADRAWDDGIPTLMGRNLTQLGEPNNTVTYRMPVNTEGGTFQATSDGVCFTSARQIYNMSCLDSGCDADILYLPLNDLQTHPYTLELEASWSAYAGCDDVIVTYSVTDDGTGHIDMYMKVASDNLVIMGEYEAPYGNDAAEYNAGRLDANAAFIANYAKPSGGGFTVGRVVMPGHRNTNEGPIPFTYINSTIINGLNLWPATSYSSWSDTRIQAQGQWETLMPDHEHIWIDATEISFWSGAVHCITRTIPDKDPGLWIADGTCEAQSCNAPEDGYGHACFPTNYTEAPICWGPDWLCSCNDCDVCGPPAGSGDDPCQGIGYEGCCEGSLLKYCENGQLQGGNCGNEGCGWDNANGYYDCGESGADPSGTFPLSCEPDAPCEPSCDGAVCGSDGCGGSCGTCPEGQGCNGAGQCVETCVPACGDKVCGGDGCGGSCGTCKEDQVCEEGVCQAAPSACGELTYEGCCDGLLLNWCQDGEPLTQSCENSCGWNSEYGYLCGETGEDPSGEFPILCGACEPECDGKECGDDGCGGSCGACSAGFNCSAGQCVEGPCQPDCSGKDCGNDGCGGSCGTCPAGQGCSAQGLCQDVCVPNCEGATCGGDGCGGSCGVCGAGELCEAGQCVSACGDLTYEGCCDGLALQWCENEEVQTLNCSNSCGWSAANDYYDCGQTGAEPSGTFPLSCDDLGCTPDCEDKACGDDGCGGSCGACGLGEACSDAGLCEEGPCTPDCSGKVCGDDSCGGSCGTCAEGSYCTAEGQCEAGACAPQCDGKVCGDDGCGGSCGACAAGETCTEFGDCKASACEPQCDGKVCGADGCGGSCGACDAGSVCIAGQCTGDGPCEPDCEGKACGSDGCGGWCGTCIGDDLCTAEGQCVPPQCAPECGGKVCGADGCGGSCGACPAGQACTPGGQCVSDCVPDCEGKVCGSDGCGDLCGSCDEGEFCSPEGACLQGACVPDCDGKACGDDGCGQLCGTCDASETCSPQYECVPAACVPDCSFKDCGDDGCGGQCGDCPAGQVCGKEFRCEFESCDPQCDGKSCGDDGCGGQCGQCSGGEECSKEGACIAEASCQPECEGKACGDDGCGTLCGVCAEGESCDAGQCTAGARDQTPDTPDPDLTPGSGTTDPNATDATAAIGGAGEGGVAEAEGCQSAGHPTSGWPLVLVFMGLWAWARRRRLPSLVPRA